MKPLIYIAKAECVERYAYRIQSRNLRFGVYRAESGGFLGIRTKFGSRFVFEEYHWDNGPPYGTVKPQEKLEEVLPDSILLAARLLDAGNSELFAWLEEIEKKYEVPRGEDDIRPYKA